MSQDKKPSAAGGPSMGPRAASPASEPDVSIRKPYAPTVRHPLRFKRPTMTKQSHKDECDINTIMSRYEKTGILSHYSEGSPQYGDFSDVTDYSTALRAIQAAEAAFQSLSARVRRRFDNDPAAFLSFVQDEANREEAIQLGLIDPPVPEQKASAEGGIVSGDQPDSVIEAKPKSGEPKASTPSLAT